MIPQQPVEIKYNYFEFNYYFTAHATMPGHNMGVTYPRSYCIGVFGLQKAELHFNRLANPQLDFEAVVALWVR